MSNFKKKTVIKCNNVGKKYELRLHKPTLMETLLSHKKEAFWALKNINLDIKQGERIAVIGENGAGKTTFLKLISQITQPTEGSVKTTGKLVSLIDLNAGFHPDLSGRENILLNGLILGESKKNIQNRASEIIEFAGINNFIDAPFYTYSSGMKLRLAFAVCVHIKADIYLFDEGIYAGDSKYQEKIYQKLEKLFKDKTKTFIFTSHIMKFLEYYCKTAIVLEKGKITKKGSIKSIIKRYEEKKK